MRWDGLRLHDQDPPPGQAQRGTARQNPARVDASWTDQAQLETAPPGTVRPDPPRPGTVRPDPPRPGTAQAGTAQAGTAQPDTARPGTARPGTARPATGAGGFGPQAALFGRDAVARTFDTPGFRGMTFYEVHARSIINKVPERSRMPFRATINPYRGCGHACVYCFARNTHAYLDLDTGLDFNSKIIVKVNAPELARRDLPRWPGEHIAMGTNVDPYQRAEGRYKLMPGIIEALSEAGNPFSILTKGTLLLRDLDLLEAAADRTTVGLNVSVGFIDQELSASVEPGTPSPQRRLDACATITSRGLRCGVLMGPVLPFLSDSPTQLDRTVRQIADSGAASVSPIVLHLRPGAREWYLTWLAEHHPDLVDDYRRLYARGAYAPKDYQQRISAMVGELARKYGVGRTRPASARRVVQSSRAPDSRPPDSRAPDSRVSRTRTSRRPAAGHTAAQPPAGPAGTQLTLL
ncbi:MAG TPA: Rv2578c family radical SAM protein [Streptosporangiaceae bacterium]|nr:Rv2578c family radical SAM protein [Streptosporangiaceae bacterium]